MSSIIALSFGIVIFLGIPLALWLPGGLAEFFSSTPRVLYALVITGLQFFSVVYFPRPPRTKGKSAKDGGRNLDLALIMLLSMVSIIIPPLSDRLGFWVFTGGDVIRYAGLFLIVPGFVLMQAAEKYLDRQFSVEIELQENHRLIQDGPYRHLRHPRYLGIIVFFVGISLVFASYLSLLVNFALLLILAWRVQQEDEMMHHAFGEEWEEYSQRTWRIVPFIY